VADLAAAIDIIQGAGARSVFLTPGGMPAPEPESCVNFVRPNRLKESVNHLQRSVQSARHYLVESVRLGHLASPAAQWVIDNAYLITLNLSELGRELPIAFRTIPAAQATELFKLAHGFASEITHESPKLHC